MFYPNTPNNTRTQMQPSYGFRPNMPEQNTAGAFAYQTRGGRNCGCDAREERTGQYPVAMAYVPFQRFGEVYPFERGFETGTIFPVLNLPFLCANPACNRRGGRA